jgi:hypothetical protein
MGGILFSLLSALIWIAIVVVFASVITTALKKKRTTIAADGHVIPPEKDITCEGKENHQHPKLSAMDQKDYGPRYIVHDDPETGYVILNGIKRKITDCKDL